MKQIILNTGNYALVDDDDFERINKHKWVERCDGYAHRISNIAGRHGFAVCVLMHREILKLICDDGKQTHHINYKKLDNRKSNLQVCTLIQHRCYKHSPKGCSWNKNTNKWQAEIKFNGKRKHLGCFDNEKEAHEAYLRAKQKYHRIN